MSAHIRGWLWGFTAGCLFALLLVDGGWRWREARDAAAAEQVGAEHDNRVNCQRPECLWV